MLAGGIIQTTMGLMIATGFVGPYEAALERYTTSKSSGPVINRGIYTIGASIVLGILTEISYALREIARKI